MLIRNNRHMYLSLPVFKVDFPTPDPYNFGTGTGAWQTGAPPSAFLAEFLFLRRACAVCFVFGIFRAFN